MERTLVEFQDLQTHFFTEDGVVKAVDGVSFRISEGKTLGVVGESGCGKSVTALSLLGLIPQPPGRVVGGEILFRGKNLLELDRDEMAKLRGNVISMIFQEPMTSLNPVFTVGHQIDEVFMAHRGLTPAQSRKESVAMLQTVGISRAEEIADSYPHELSGGMRQRVMIAMAMACNPSLLLADEPTTALDVTVQAQILDLMRNLQKKFNSAIMLITHDLGVVAEMAHHVVVMYCGKVVEEAGVEQLFADPLHPYTASLLKAKPTLNGGGERLYTIPGQVPNPIALPAGCRFAPRCARVMERCRKEMPVSREVGKGHKVSCWLYGEGGRR